MLKNGTKNYKIGAFESILSSDMLLMIKLFVSSNQALVSLSNTHLRKLLHPKIKLPSPFTFRNAILPETMEHLYILIGSKLDKSLCVCLIIDIAQTKKNLACLANLAFILLNIPSSSHFIERFFSICGVVCGKRSLSMKDDLIIDRSILKSNLHLLNELSEN